jgi:hypothetical protein
MGWNPNTINNVFDSVTANEPQGSFRGRTNLTPGNVRAALEKSSVEFIRADPNQQDVASVASAHA